MVHAPQDGVSWLRTSHPGWVTLQVSAGRFACLNGCDLVVIMVTCSAPLQVVITHQSIELTRRPTFAPAASSPLRAPRAATPFTSVRPAGSRHHVVSAPRRRPLAIGDTLQSATVVRRWGWGRPAAQALTAGAMPRVAVGFPAQSSVLLSCLPDHRHGLITPSHATLPIPLCTDKTCGMTAVASLSATSHSAPADPIPFTAKTLGTWSE